MHTFSKSVYFYLLQLTLKISFSSSYNILTPGSCYDCTTWIRRANNAFLTSLINMEGMQSVTPESVFKENIFLSVFKVNSLAEYIFIATVDFLFLKQCIVAH